ncbi:MAG TPA: MFS transporter [Flavobacteriales bacterium]|nr:MFS transporter [Flavobacteriales bacterium]HNI05856.1 MFS transporter [Flavobacteriales bacterium]
MHQPPALSTNAPLRYLTFGTLYFAQGIPQGLQLYAIPAWMAVHGADATAVGGYVGICTLPWTFKLIAGPLMDRYGFLPMGRRRPWLLCAGLGMVLTLMALALVPDPLHHMGLFMAVSFVGNCFGAVQDVATDGLAVDITPEDQQARANGVMWGAKVAGISATLTAGTWAINTYGFGDAVAVIALILLAVLVLPSLLRERQGERLFPWSKGSISAEAKAMKAESWKEILVALKRVLALRNSLVGCACFMLWGLINGLIDTQWPLFTIQQLGWDNSAYANITAGAGMVSAIAAMLLAGWLADRVGKLRVSTMYLALMAAGWLMMGLAPQLWPHGGYLPAFIYGSKCVVTFYQVATLALAMSLCWARVAATQFTLYMVCNNVGVVAGAALLGPLRSSLSWSGLFLLFAAALVTLLLAWQFMRLARHKTALERLEQHHAEQVTGSLASEGSLVPDLGMPGTM